MTTASESGPDSVCALRALVKWPTAISAAVSGVGSSIGSILLCASRKPVIKLEIDLLGVSLSSSSSRPPSELLELLFNRAGEDVGLSLDPVVFEVRREGGFGDARGRGDRARCDCSSAILLFKFSVGDAEEIGELIELSIVVFVASGVGFRGVCVCFMLPAGGRNTPGVLDINRLESQSTDWKALFRASPRDVCVKRCLEPGKLYVRWHKLPTFRRVSRGKVATSYLGRSI